MYRLIGGHTNHTYGGIPELVATWEPPVWLVMNPGPEWRWVSPKTKYTWRVFSDYQPDFNSDIDPVWEARNWMASVLPWTGNVVGGYWQGTNESVISSPTAMKRFAEYEIERIRLLASHGLKAAIGAFAVGNPPNMSWWEQFKPALRAAKEHGGVLILHQYWWETTLDTRFVSPPWTSLRHRKVYDGEPTHDWDGLTEEYRIPLIIVEAGADRGVWENGVIEGWTRIRTPEQYCTDINTYSLEIQKDPYVLGTCMFCCGNSSALWIGYDIWPGVARRIMRDAVPLYRRYTVDEKYAKGIDVSQWQRKINWARVKRSGISFAFIRATVGLKVDPWYKRNHNRARRNGVLVGPYHFQTRDDPREQAQLFMSTIKPFEILAIQDVETYKNKGPHKGMVHAFSEELWDNDVPMGYYTSMYMWDYKLHISPAPWAGEHSLMVADWSDEFYGNPRKPKDWTGWEFQQYTSKGKVPGITGNVDMDIFNGTRRELEEKYGNN